MDRPLKNRIAEKLLNPDPITHLQEIETALGDLTRNHLPKPTQAQSPARSPASPSIEKNCELQTSLLQKIPTHYRNAFEKNPSLLQALTQIKNKVMQASKGKRAESYPSVELSHPSLRPTLAARSKQK